MKRMCEGVLHMTVLSDDEDSEPPPDFIVSLTTDIATSLSKTGMERLTDACPHVLICQDLASAYWIMSLKDDVSRRGYEVLPQPYVLLFTHTLSVHTYPSIDMTFCAVSGRVNLLDP
jgi:hypothetical protein